MGAIEYYSYKVPYYIIVYPNDLKAKVYQLKDDKFDKVDDFTNEIMNFDALACGGKINFEKVFKRFRK